MAWYSPGVRRDVLGVTVVVVALSILVGYVSYRIERQHMVVPARDTPSVPVSACRDRPISTGVPPRPVVTFGDSITAGYGSTNNCVPPDVRSIVPASRHLVRPHDTSYPGDLARLLRRPILNYGVGNESTAEGLIRLRRLLRGVHPSIVVVLEGVNDLIAGQKPLGVAYHLLRMATLIRQSGARPILLTVLPTDGPHLAPFAGRVALLNRLILAGAKGDHIAVVDTAAAFAAHKPPAAFFRHTDGREDGLHPNDVGYRVLAVLVYQALRHT